MKQITNKEYEEWQKYKAEKAKGHRTYCNNAGIALGLSFLEVHITYHIGETHSLSSTA